MPYTDMSVPEGRKFLPKIRNLFFKPLADENFFVEPWSNRELGDCAEFRLGAGKNGSDEVLFFVSDTGLISFLKEAKGELYLFGAYNQINVCQMRARGTVTLEEGHPEIGQVKVRLRSLIEPRVGSMVEKLDKAEAEERYAILNNGLPFCFRVGSYAYHMYDRG
jgi:hypothetical protein